MYSASRRARSSFGSTTGSFSTTRSAGLLVVRRVTVRRAGAFLAAVFFGAALVAPAFFAVGLLTGVLAVFALVLAAFLAAGRFRGPGATRLGVSLMKPASPGRAATRTAGDQWGPGRAGR